ncbi:hypothetical protein A0256_17590 [Mucilaginibacter sp. PAMC 26640]|nr:hypothetical protein A0256_17590 [Mucilaginibacter sp. PAMC 26640]
MTIKYLWRCLLLFPLCAHGQEKKSYSLANIIDLAIHHSTSAKLAGSNKQALALSFENYKATLKPQVVISGSLANYSKEYSKISQDDGSFRFIPIRQNYSSLGATLSQSVLATGADISLTTNLSRFDDFGNHYRQYSGSPYNLMVNQPLFAYNRFKWQKQIEPLKLQESRKAFTQEMENLSDNVVTYFFDAVEASVNKQLAVKNLFNIQHLYEIENKRVSLGTTTKDKILQLKLRILNSQQDLQKSNVDFKSAIYKLKTYAGIKDTALNDLLIPDTLPVMRLSLDQAIAEAKMNRKEFIAFKRRILEAKSNLESANRERYSITLSAVLGLSGSDADIYGIYSSSKGQQQLSLNLSIPIVDWGRNKGKRDLALSNLKTEQYNVELEQLAIVQEIVSLVQNTELISDNIQIARQADSIANERYELAEQQFLIGRISLTDLHIALTEKDEAKRSFIKNLRLFWESYYHIRRLTLFDFVGGKKINYDAAD